MNLSDAATAAVTNRANTSNIAPLGSDALAVNDNKAVTEICSVAGVDEMEARSALRAAVSGLGGRIESRRRQGGLAAGRMQSHPVEIWWVPRDALHD